jgi:hypothetical protein
MQLPCDDVAGDWCSISEAARRLGVSRRAVHGRIQRGTLTARNDNAGPRVFIAHGTVPRPSIRLARESHAPPHGTSHAAFTGEPHGTLTAPVEDVLAELRKQLEALGLRAGQAEGELRATRETLATKDALIAELRVRAEHAESDLGARDALLAKLREAAATERVRAGRLEAALAEARRPWWRRWVR